MMSLSKSFETDSISPTESYKQPFPAYIRREYTSPPLPGVERSGTENRNSSWLLPTEFEEDENRVVYAPMAEKRKLGYISTSALIVNKMIGTGIFSTPSSILRNTGTKGGALLIWFAGGIMTLAALFVYMEFGIILPFNGGELVYLDESYKRPRYLASCIFAMLFVIFGSTAANSLAFSKDILLAINPENPTPDDRLLKFLSFVTISFICLIHVFSRKMGLVLNNCLAIYKVALLTFVVLAGFIALSGARTRGADRSSEYGVQNLENAFSRPNGGPYGYATAMLSVLFSYQGWENANYVLGEVRRPQGDVNKTYRRAALASFGLVTTLYMLANVAYFAASTTEEITQQGVSVAADFFIKVFGNGQFVIRGLKVLIAFSAFGNIVAVSYANSRVKQEIARQRLLPFSKYWARESPYATPVGALTLHWIFTSLVIFATPPSTKNDEAYNLTTIIYTYGHTWVGIAIGIGLILLYHRKQFHPKLLSWPVLCIFIMIHLILSTFTVVLLWFPAKTAVIAWYVPPTTATVVLVGGVVYWFGFAKILPWLGFQIDDEPVELIDGSKVVMYKRYRTGWARSMTDWWEKKIRDIRLQ